VAKPSDTKSEEILLDEGKTYDEKRISCHMREIIRLVGEDPHREGLRKFGDARLSLRKALQDCSPRRIGQRHQCLV